MIALTTLALVATLAPTPTQDSAVRISDMCYRVPKYQRVVTPVRIIGDVTEVAEKYVFVGMVTICSDSYREPKVRTEVK